MLTLSTGIGLTGTAPRGDVVEPTPAPPVTAIIMGQSELEYLFNRDPFYRTIAQPVPGDGNLIVFTQDGAGAPVRTVVNQASVDAGQVNPAMAALSALLAHSCPGTTFVLGDGAVSGTSRRELMNDADADRMFADFAAVAEAIESEFGAVQHLVENWYGSDAGFITGNGGFRNNFWPMYFGTTADGSPFPLGGVAPHGDVVDHCLWDGTAAPEAKGRGIFTRAGTRWHVMTPKPFLDAPVAPAEALNFSEGGPRLSEPARQLMHDLAGDALAQSVGLVVGPSGHLSDFSNPRDEIHPDVDTPDGQILLIHALAVCLIRAAGRPVGEPRITDVTVEETGLYADLVVDLPNGGTLTTLRGLRGTAYTGLAPHRQEVTGVEMTRGGARRPVFNLSETGYPANFRGSVTISDSGSGTPRQGRVRITPEVPFAFGDSLSYLRGQATAALQEPRDFDLYPDFLIEHVPDLHDGAASYPFEGIPVQPYQQDALLPLAPPAFTPRGVRFDGASRLVGRPMSMTGGDRGLISAWIKNDQSSWLRDYRALAIYSDAGVPMFELLNLPSSMAFRMRRAGGGWWTPPLTPSPVMALGEWYHVMVAWESGVSTEAYVNGVSTFSDGNPGIDSDGATLKTCSVGAVFSGAAAWTGDIAHLWMSVSQTLDITDKANRDKFMLNGAPVNLGGNGELPTGIAPELYFDGDGAEWNNRGTAPVLGVVGTLTASALPGY